MTGQPIGIARLLKENRQWCEEAIAQLANGPGESRSHPRENAKLQSPVHLTRQQSDDLDKTVRGVARLQKQANAKLTPTSLKQRLWWVTEKSLQQSTPWQVAELKSGWFGSTPLYDLCCGIGGDSIALAARGVLTAVDLDPIIAAMAEMNLALGGYGDPRATVRCADVAELPLPRGVAVHIDPDRRPSEQRRSDPAACLPAWPEVCRIVADASAAVIKLAPAAAISEHEFDLSQCHRVWISLQGSVREQSLLHGAAVDAARLRRGGRSAAILRADQTVSWFAPDANSMFSPPPDRAAPQTLLVDPNAAIRAAGLTEAFATHYELDLMSGPAGFLTGQGEGNEADAMQGLAVTGRVEWWGACDDRKLRREFRARGVHPAVVKVRGTEHDPAQLVKRYRKCGDRPVKLWIGRTAKRVFAAITQ